MRLVTITNQLKIIIYDRKIIHKINYNDYKNIIKCFYNEL